MARPDYIDYFHPNRTRMLRDLLAGKNWRDVYLIAKQIQHDMGQLATLAQAEMAQQTADELIAQLKEEPCEN